MRVGRALKTCLARRPSCPPLHPLHPPRPSLLPCAVTYDETLPLTFGDGAAYYQVGHSLCDGRGPPLCDGRGPIAVRWRWPCACICVGWPPTPRHHGRRCSRHGPAPATLPPPSPTPPVTPTNWSTRLIKPPLAPTTALSPAPPCPQICLEHRDCVFPDGSGDGKTGTISQ
jgi:hypothetical protein